MIGSSLFICMCKYLLVSADKNLNSIVKYHQCVFDCFHLWEGIGSLSR